MHEAFAANSEDGYSGKYAKINCISLGMKTENDKWKRNNSTRSEFYSEDQEAAVASKIFISALSCRGLGN